MSGKNREYNIDINQLKELVESHGGVSEVARKIGLPRSLVCEHCNGKRKVSFDAFVDYCNFFEVPAEELLGLEEKRQKNKVNLTLLRMLIYEYGGITKVAKEMGYSKSLISHHYNGTRSVSIDSLVEYAKLFNVSTDKLLGLPDEPENEKLLLASEYTNLPMGIVNQLHDNENRDADFVAYMLRCRNEWGNSHG